MSLEPPLSSATRTMTSFRGHTAGHTGTSSVYNPRALRGNGPDPPGRLNKRPGPQGAEEKGTAPRAPGLSTIAPGPGLTPRIARRARRSLKPKSSTLSGTLPARPAPDQVGLAGTPAPPCPPIRELADQWGDRSLCADTARPRPGRIVGSELISQQRRGHLLAARR